MFMKHNLFSVDERLTLLGVLLNRCDFIEKVILSLDSVRDSKMVELYTLELSHLKSVLKKLGYENGNC